MFVRAASPWPKVPASRPFTVPPTPPISSAVFRPFREPKERKERLFQLQLCTSIGRNYARLFRLENK